MRVGVNPQKGTLLETDKFVHLIVLPVYIPNLNGYYAESLKILESCITSLRKTVHDKTFISVINNGSCSEVKNYLIETFNANIVNELIHTDNIGKINAVLKGIAGHNMPLITITDADIFFKNNWQEETLKVFNNFPKAAVVGLIPQFKLFSSFSCNLIFDNFWSKNLRFTKVKNPKAMKLFYKSIGWENNYNKSYLNRHLTFSSGNCNAIVGSGHAVATYKKELFLKSDSNYSKYKLGGDSNTNFLDVHVLKYDAWRLTTEENYAFHMGNTEEPWMRLELDKLNTSKTKFQFNLKPYSLKVRPIAYFIKCKIFKRVLKIQFIYRFFLKIKRLPTIMIRNY